MKGAKLNIEAGQKYNKLTVINEAPKAILPSGQINRMIECKCDCGTVKNIRLVHLVRGKITSCGCIGGEKHNMAGSKLYRVWTGMKNRCNTDTYIDVHRYKARGIEICDSWSHSFIEFQSWALSNGYKEGLQIDRINNDGNYEPGNCRFVTNIINVNNREVTMMVNYNGEIIALSILLRQKNLLNNYAAIRGRINRGWETEKAINTPIRKGNYKRKFTEFISESAEGF